MIFEATKLSSAYLIRMERLSDNRGFFARAWCQREFEAHGLNPRLVQCNVSYNEKAGTLRGMHYQVEPQAEAKLVRCTNGAIYDVIIDLRPTSPTFMQHIGVTLTADEHTMLYVPEGCAHGFLTLEDHTEIFYQMSEFYMPTAARGFRWDDPAFAITWPRAITVISGRDATYPNFNLTQESI
ncbi:MAG: dTDP-4-dehydrorhamnose 3,5-epimerase [Caldilinea sp. CFX5]|nr:dTDP-4-dehydrorhamnose 3,5-epimerase [Caldilinea sp. CFX5]